MRGAWGTSERNRAWGGAEGAVAYANQRNEKISLSLPVKLHKNEILLLIGPIKIKEKFSSPRICFYEGIN